MKKKPLIIYRKRGEPQKVVPFNKLGDIACLRKDVYNTNYYMDILYINKDIEFIKFRNITFPKITNIVCEEDNTCILENCNSNGEFPNLIFDGYNYRIIEPKFRPETKFKFRNVKSVIYVCHDNNGSEYELRTDSFKYIEKIEIHDNKSIRNIYLEAEEIYLHGFFRLSQLRLNRYSEKVTIGNSEEQTEITSESSIEINTQNLNLNNCTIQTNDEYNDIILNFEKLTGSSFVIKSKSRIIINNIIITDENDSEYNNSTTKNKFIIVPRDEDGCVTITDKVLAKINLIDFLRKLSKTASANLDAEIEAKFHENYGKQTAAYIADLETRKNNAINEGQQQIAELKKKINYISATTQKQVREIAASIKYARNEHNKKHARTKRRLLEKQPPSHIGELMSRNK